MVTTFSSAPAVVGATVSSVAAVVTTFSSAPAVVGATVSSAAVVVGAGAEIVVVAAARIEVAGAAVVGASVMDATVVSATVVGASVAGATSGVRVAQSVTCVSDTVLTKPSPGKMPNVGSLPQVKPSGLAAGLPNGKPCRVTPSRTTAVRVLPSAGPPGGV